MVASSLESAKDLIKACANGRDATRANNGILIGSGKIEQLQRDEGRAIQSYNNEIQAPEVAYSFRSAYLPLHDEDAGGTLYRTGDDIIGLQGNQEICLKIIKFYLVEHEHLYTPFVICDAYEYILDDEGCQLRHQLSDTIYVKPFQTCTCIGLFDIVRPIMLWLEPDGNVQLWIILEKPSLFPRLLSQSIPNQVTWSVSKETKRKYGMLKFDRLIMNTRE